MNVGINQARQQGAVAEVNALCSRRMLYRRPHFDNFFAFDQYFARRNDFPSLDVEHARRVQDYRVTSRTLGESLAERERYKHHQSGRKMELCGHDARWYHLPGPFFTELSFSRLRNYHWRRFSAAIRTPRVPNNKEIQYGRRDGWLGGRDYDFRHSDRRNVHLLFCAQVALTRTHGGDRAWRRRPHAAGAFPGSEFAPLRNSVGGGSTWLHTDLRAHRTCGTGRLGGWHLWCDSFHYWPRFLP